MKNFEMKAGSWNIAYEQDIKGGPPDYVQLRLHNPVDTGTGYLMGVIRFDWHDWLRFLKDMEVERATMPDGVFEGEPK